MQSSTSIRPHSSAAFGSRALRQFAAVTVAALAAALMPPAHAAPYGGHDHHAAISGLGGMVMAHPRQLERLFDSIGATAEQRAQVQQIVQAARADLRAQRDASRALREQGQALFAAPQIDATAVEALRQQMLAQHDEASKRMMQALLEVSRVLTPEQRQQVAERMAERRAMMERRRAEREATAPSKP